MHCPKCRKPTPDDSFCCPTCGTLLVDHPAFRESGAADLRRELAAAYEAVRCLRRYIPPVVAEGILRDQERLRGERREVAILFVDAVNFTRLAASLDAESVFNLVNDLLGRLVECVYRYDGMVDKFTGDGLMAIFGAPIAHENDPELAIRAALDMQRAVADMESTTRAQLGAPLQIRVGIHCGPVIAGILGTQRQAAYTVIGEAVNLAARLETVARPGRILVSARMYHQTRALFKFQAMGMVQVKGIAQPVSVYEVVKDIAGVTSGRGVGGGANLLLGRDAELKQLGDLLASFLRDRRGRLVIIRGEAGIGKSQLVSYWMESIPHDQVSTWYGRALPYAQSVSFGLFRSLLQDALRTYSPGVTWDARVSHPLRIFLWQVLGLLEPEEQAAMRYLEPERVKQSTIMALREWVLGETRTHPVVLILEDLQWADDLSRDALRALVDLVDQAPLLLCVTARPQLDLDLWLRAGENAPRPTEHFLLDLEPLAPEHSRALLGHLADLSSMPEDFVESILTRAEGNPFFIEEFVRMLVDEEVLAFRNGRWQMASEVALESLELPDTLRGLIMARVDRLPDDLRRVMCDAAVIGLQFDARLLEEVERRLRNDHEVASRLDRLVEVGLLVGRPQAGERVYAFRHGLTREIIYGSLLSSQRAELHRMIAECIEQLYAADLNNYAEALAFHYDRANVPYRAMCYMLLAGDRARERFANREAIEYYGRALQISQRLDITGAERWQAAVGLGDVYQRIGEYENSVACYQAALEEWPEAIPESRAQVMLKLGQVWSRCDSLQEAESWLQQGLDELSRSSEAWPDLRGRIYAEMGWLNLKRGDLAASQEWLERGLALISGTEHYDVLSSLLDCLGLLHYEQGNLEQAVEYVKRALEHRSRQSDVFGMAHSLNNLAKIKWLSGDWDGALADWEHAADLCDRIGETAGLIRALTAMGLLFVERGAWAEAEERLQRGLVAARRFERLTGLMQVHLCFAHLCLAQQRWDDCLYHLDAAASLGQQVGNRAKGDLGEVYQMHSLLCLEQGRIEEAVEWAARSGDLLQEVAGGEGHAIRWGRHERLLGRIALARADLQSARRHLERSAAIFQTSGARFDAARTAYWNGAVSLALQERNRAREELVAARDVFERLKAVPDLRRVEEKLALEDWTSADC